MTIPIMRAFCSGRFKNRAAEISLPVLSMVKRLWTIWVIHTLRASADLISFSWISISRESMDGRCCVD